MVVQPWPRTPTADLVHAVEDGHVDRMRMARQRVDGLHLRELRLAPELDRICTIAAADLDEQRTWTEQIRQLRAGVFGAAVGEMDVGRKFDTEVLADRGLLQKLLLVAHVSGDHGRPPRPRRVVRRPGGRPGGPGCG